MAIVSHMAPFPPGFKPKWRDILEKHVALYRRMPEELTLCAEELVPWFMERTQWEWANWEGKRPDAEMAKVCVSFLACVLIVNRTKEDLAHFHTFVFHPSSVTDEDGLTWGGLAHSSGKIEQSWESTKWGMEDGEDNRDVTIHEFAHMIDFRNTLSDSVPHFDCSDAQREYVAFLDSEYKDICDAWEKSRGCKTIRKYATTERAELLTCATESFFGNSEMLQFLRPNLYEWMRKIYKMDPEQWRKRISAAELHDFRGTLWRKWSPVSRWRNRSNEIKPWPTGVPATEYFKWAEKELGEDWREERERLVKGQQKLLWSELKKEIEGERERIDEERKQQERHLLNNRTVVIDFPNGMPQLKYKLVHGQRDGLWQRWDEQMNLREEVEYIGGFKHGKVTYYHSGGKKELTGFYQMNERAGVWEGWHEDGSRSFRSTYHKGQLQHWEQFDAEGVSRSYGKAKNRFGR